MIDKLISDKVLTVGCEYSLPRGGIAQLMNNYEKYVFKNFKCVINSAEGNFFYKILKLCIGLIMINVRLLFDKDIRIVHIHTASNNSFRRSVLFFFCARFYRKKIVLHVHGGGFQKFYRNNQKFVTKIFDKCDCIITLSEYWQLFFQQITKCKNIQIVENLVSLPLIGNTQFDDSLTHILFMGWIVQEKGIYDLLDVIAEHKDEFKNRICLHVAGNKQVEQLLSVIKEKELSDIVLYEGWISGEIKTKLLSSVDIFIQPSYAEGLPLSILEAMSYGKPILATPVGGVPELVDESNGILFEAGSKKLIYNAIHRLMYDSVLRKEMGKKSRIKSHKYLPDAVEKKLQSIYNFLIFG